MFKGIILSRLTGNTLDMKLLILEIHASKAPAIGIAARSLSSGKFARPLPPVKQLPLLSYDSACHNVAAALTLRQIILSAVIL